MARNASFPALITAADLHRTYAALWCFATPPLAI